MLLTRTHVQPDSVTDLHDGFHSADGDLLLYLPKEKVLAGIDLMAPGWVPLLDWDGSENMFAYLGAFDRVLAYEFDAFISGHTPDVARRAAAGVRSRWLEGPMKGVDLWTESHCRAMVLYVRWHSVELGAAAGQSLRGRGLSL